MVHFSGFGCSSVLADFWCAQNQQKGLDLPEDILELYFKTNWAQHAGLDQFGIWADLKIRDSSLRMRFVPSGRLLPCFDWWMVEGEHLHPLRPFEMDSFWLSECLVTQEFWENQGKSNLSFFQDPQNPLESTSPLDFFCFLSEVRSQTGLEIGIPWENQWEYVTTCGELWEDFLTEEEKDSYCWNSENSKNETHPVKTKKPNKWGFYDLFGNVWEWVLKSPKQKSRYDREEDPLFVLKGGSYQDNPNIYEALHADLNRQNRYYMRHGYRICLQKGLPDPFEIYNNLRDPVTSSIR